MKEWSLKLVYLCCFFLLLSPGGLSDAPSARVQSHPTSAEFPRGQPHFGKFQPPLGRERERPGPRLGHYGEIFLLLFFLQ